VINIACTKAASSAGCQKCHYRQRQWANASCWQTVHHQLAVTVQSTSRGWCRTGHQLPGISRRTATVGLWWLWSTNPLSSVYFVP